MKTEKRKHYEWLHFSQAYLQVAKFACEEFIKLKNSGSYIYQDLWLVIPIFYNTKHGIEIFIKTLSQFIDGQYNNKSHNIHELFTELKREIKRLKISPFTDEGNEITKNDIKNFPSNIDNLERLIKKFYQVEMLKNNINDNLNILDTKNDVFRFPDREVSTQINWESIIDKFSNKEILETKNEIGELETLFNKVGYIINLAGKKIRTGRKE